jgi:ATP-binding cassette subfamily F protein uup
MLLTLRNISLAYSTHPLFESAEMTIQYGDRICLVGRNGTGKSSLLKIIAGETQPDSGEISGIDGLKVTRLIQDVPHDLTGSVYSIVAHGLGEIGKLVLEYHDPSTPADRLVHIQEALENSGSWDSKSQIDAVLSRMQLDPDSLFENLSGGIKRRVLLAQALVSQPHILLLDEPTNHLDIEAVTWLEGFLRDAPFALVFITHDRAFLDAVAERIIEVDRGKLNDWPGSFAEFQVGKQAALEVEAKHNANFDKKLAEEEAWIRRGVKARTKRNMGRVRRLEDARGESNKRQTYEKRGNIQAQDQSQATGKRVFEAENISYEVGGKVIVKDFSLKVTRGQKIALMGPNGCGKTTLIRLLLGQLEIDSGNLIEGTKLQVAYFDQTRSQLNLDQTASWNVNAGSDTVDFNGSSRHVLGYLKDFMFTPERAKSKVNVLSGGERNRLLLARLFAQPANVLVLDEPTNDLDIETLELLEDLIAAFEGTVLLVSHDRAFVNNVAENILAWEGPGQFNFYVGNYDDWVRQRKAIEKAEKKAAKQAPQAKKANKKLSYKDQRELDELPQRLEKLEAAVELAQEPMNDPNFFQQNADKVATGQEALAKASKALEDAFERWEALEALQQELANA